jgi:hypothetical protein
LNKKLLWLIPVGALILFGIFLAALPSLVSSAAHRVTIEELASSLTGRPVTIDGNLSLALFPEPRLIAERITLGGPDKETITARSLTLDIAITDLFRGRLSAKNLTLQSPHIGFPWPLPGGASAIAPPPWLTKLHAQIADGTISVGAITFENVNADIYTGASGALSVAGSGAVQNQPVNISLSLAGLDAAGTAPVAIDAAAGPASLHLSGTFNAASALSGTISFNTTQIDGLGAIGQPANAIASIEADPEQIVLTKLQLFQGDGRLTGTATLALANPILTLTLAGSDLQLPGLDILDHWAAPAIPVYFALDATASTFAGITIPHLATRAELSAAGADISTLSAVLPGNSALSLTGTIDPTGHIAGHAGLDSNDFSALLNAFGAGITTPDAWRQTSLTARLAGTLPNLQFQHLSGTLGPGYVTGSLLLDRAATPPHLGGALHFDTLDLTPFGAGQIAAAPFSADFEITADRALYQHIHMTNLLIDASLDDQLLVRRLSASLYNGFLATSFTRARDGDISSARALLSLPSATSLASLLPAAYQPPAAVTDARLAAAITAAGPPNALATSATLTLGDFILTAAPTIDLAKLTATGPLTLRHPSAIAALKIFGLDGALRWPGAGSLSLRASMDLNQTQFGLTDFVLSFGDLSATGRLQLRSEPTGQHDYEADLAADTMALPPWPADPSALWAALIGASGKITLSANRVLLAGRPILGRTTAAIALAPSNDVVTISQASLADGNLSGKITATTAAATPPSLTAAFALTNADASQINLPIAFPLTLPTGTLAIQGRLTGAGYGPQTWAATLAGTVNLAAKSGTLNGFNLPGMNNALGAMPRNTALSAACLAGVTPFDTLSVAASLDHGLTAITAASLEGPPGNATATGSIDIPDQGISLSLAIHPAVPSPPSIGLALDGTWTKPQLICDTREALAWTAAR